jgi:hypothetical protein
MLDYFNALLSGGSEKTHEELQSEQLVSRSRFQQCTFRIHDKIVVVHAMKAYEEVEV